MKIGDKIFATTNANFINKLFGKNYVQWMKSKYKIENSDNMMAWFLSFDGEKKNSGWTNYILNDMVVEKYTSPNELTYRQSHEFINPKQTIRAIFNKEKGTYGFEYVFLGVYEIDLVNSTNQNRIWKRILTEFNF